MKSTRKFKLLSAVLVLAMVCTMGCTYDEVLPVEPEGDISFSQDLQPFFDNRCTSCHNGGIVPLDLTAAVAYDEIINGGYINAAIPKNSLFYTKIDIGGSMEPYANATERAITLKWIEQGALNN